MKNTIPVLLYHHINHHAGDTVTISPDVFAAQMRFLSDSGYRFLTLRELLEIVNYNEVPARNAVVITFDDGWLDNYLFAYPSLLKYCVKSISFLVTGRVTAAKNTSLPGDVPCHDKAKQLANSSEAGRVVMGWDLVRTLQGEGLMEFYSHTVTHRRCTDLGVAELAAELRQSKAVLETELGRSCSCLCWPYGDFNAATVDAALAAGYSTLFTTEDGFVTAGSDPCRIRRIEVKDSVEWLKDRLFKRDI